MTPEARHQAAIDVLDQISGGQPAEKALISWARRSRFAGSKDRAAVRDIVFDVLRARGSSSWLGGGQTGRRLVLGWLRLNGRDPCQVFSGEGHAPPSLSAEELQAPRDADPPIDADVPEWLRPQLSKDLGSQYATFCAGLRNRAPLCLRVNPRKAPVAQAVQALAQENIETTPHPKVPLALIVESNPRRVALSQPYKKGWVEIQDGASQALVLELPAKTDDRVLDYCAGGGGKSLAMAAAVDLNIEAHDISQARMKDLPSRAKRAGTPVKIVSEPRGLYDLVLCDAPCSGTGTWRRTPDAKWALTEARLRELCRIQTEIVQTALTYVRPGGLFAYATCSVLRCENDEMLDRFQIGTETVSKVFLPDANGDGFFLKVYKTK